MVLVDLPALPDERGRWGEEGEDSWGDAVAWVGEEEGAVGVAASPPRVVALVARNGLCNRLAGIGGLWALAEHHGASFEVLWEGEIACPCAFGDVFEECAGFALVDRARVDALVGAADCWVFETKRASHFWAAPWVFLLSRVPGGPSFAAFDAAARRCLGRLAPSAAVRGRINAFLSLGPWGLLDLGARTVGVHVRATDHRTFHDGFGPYASTVERFEADLRGLLATAECEEGRPAAFLAADAAETVERLSSTFRDAVDDGRLVVRRTDFRTPHACLRVVRHTSGVDAVADLYLLARCARVLGTFQSSFSELAAVLGGVPVTCPGLPPDCRASLNLYYAIPGDGGDPLVTHGGPARRELAADDALRRPPTRVAAVALPKLPKDGGGRFRVAAPKGALLRDHVEKTGALVGLLPVDADVVAVREATSSQGVDRLWVLDRGWVSARVLRPARDADDVHARALAKYKADRHARYAANHEQWCADIQALVASGAVKVRADGRRLTSLEVA